MMYTNQGVLCSFTVVNLSRPSPPDGSHFVARPLGTIPDQSSSGGPPVVDVTQLTTQNRPLLSLENTQPATSTYIHTYVSMYVCMYVLVWTILLTHTYVCRYMHTYTHVGLGGIKYCPLWYTVELLIVISPKIGTQHTINLSTKDIIHFEPSKEENLSTKDTISFEPSKEENLSTENEVAEFTYVVPKVSFIEGPTV